MSVDGPRHQLPTRSISRYLPFAFIGAVVVLAGFFIGRSLQLGPETSELAPRGTLVEARTGDGTWLVGVLVWDDRDFVRLSSPAQVTELAGAESDGTYRVRLLSDEPTTIAGDVLIAREQLAFFGAVASGSQLEAAYAGVLSQVLRSPLASPEGS